MVDFFCKSFIDISCKVCSVLEIISIEEGEVWILNVFK